MDQARIREAFDRCAIAPRERQAATLAAFDLPPDEHAEVASLLAAHQADDATQEIGGRIDAAAADQLRLLLPRRLGPWRITGEIGAGGMGLVLAAVRDDGQFEQRAAIKLIRGLPSDRMRERLRRERRILAALEHPNIARLLDGGDSPTGEPYLVMEFVDGCTLTDWLARGPDLDRRLRAFVSLCRAVAFAHQRLVVHRDLKPGNVMMRADDSPVLLDFGIARLLEDSHANPAATHTQAMTPAWASPEQLRGQVVTTATDVYALGLLLHTLLGGSVDGRSDPLAAVSAALTPASRTAARSADPMLRRLAVRVRGELEAIVARATRIDPSERYGSAQALEADVVAWMEGRPVAAASANRLYALRKFARRHYIGLGFSVLAVVGVAGFTVRLAAERERATAEARTAREAVEFLTGIFDGLDPTRGGSPDRPARELLDRSRDALSRDSVRSAPARATLQAALGEVYRRSSQPRAAVALLQAARPTLAGDPDAVAALVALDTSIAQAHNDLTEHALALPHAEGAVTLAQSRVDEAPLALAHALMTRGVTHMGLTQFDAAREDFLGARVLFADAGAAGREGLASVLHNFGDLATRRSQAAEAAAFLEQALDAKRALYGPDHPSTFNSLLLYDLALNDLDRLAEAVALHEDLQPRIERVLGPRSGMLERALNQQASSLQDLGRLVEADAAYRRAIAIGTELEGGVPGPRQAQAINNLASLDEDRGDLASAEAGYRRSLSLRQRALPANDPAIARAQHNLARVLLRRGAVDEAMTLVEAARRARAVLPELHPERLLTKALHMEVLLARGDGRSAQQASDDLSARLARDPTLVARQAARIHSALASAARARGDTASAQSHARAALARLESAMPASHPVVAMAKLDLADALASSDPLESATLRDAATTILDRVLSADAPERGRLGRRDAPAVGVREPAARGTR